MPGWHASTKPLQDSGKLQVVGIVQEQHPDRARLFMQWKQMTWPIMVDSLGLLGVWVVPITVAIDEYGIVRHVNPKPEQLEREFVDVTYPAPATPAPVAANVSLEALENRALTEDTADAWRDYADELFRFAVQGRLDEMVAAYDKAIVRDPKDGRARFRLGVVYRRRYDSKMREPGDFSAAVDQWQRALDLETNNYIWRRRIQQYGPRLDKPYPFYDWVTEARADVVERGQTPAPLVVEPSGAEIAGPSGTFSVADKPVKSPDPAGRIRRDDKLIATEITVVPSVSRPGAPIRVHVTFRVDELVRAYWNNEADDMVLWVEPPTGWSTDTKLLSVPNPSKDETQEVREMEFELRSPAGGAATTTEIESYALYYVCEKIDGTCLYRRKDIRIPIRLRTN